MPVERVSQGQTSAGIAFYLVFVTHERKSNAMSAFDFSISNATNS